MSRIPDSDVPIKEVRSALVAVSQFQASNSSQPVTSPDLTRFGYLFPELQSDPANLLPVSRGTVQALRSLGGTMSEQGTDVALDSTIPSAYTYFGQFVDHDISRMVIPKHIRLNDPDVAPLTESELGMVKNARTATPDLDSVYGEAPHVGDDLMLLGRVTKTGRRPPGKVGDEFDLPRTGRSADPEQDRAARIGDQRNEENTITSQLHVAFLRAHNAFVAGGYSHCQARSLLRRYYQLVIIYDFLKCVADPAIVNDMLSNPWPVYDPPDEQFFMPFEFSAGAFRFGHSMVRSAYDINERFPAEFAPLLQLFNILGPYPSLPEEWIIQWENFVEGGTNKARRIDTQVAAPLMTLPRLPSGDEIRLPVRTLLRGYILSLPTGQAVAHSLGLHVMTAPEIESVAANVEQLRVLQESGFSSRTPLWFYILAEAAHFRRGQFLGPVGSTLVAGVLIALIRRSKDSILKIPGWTPALGSQYKLPDLLRLAGVL